MPNQSHVKYVPAGTGPLYWGPGDRVTFLVTGVESGGACFITEVMAPPGGGPPPHIHHHQEESFYLLEGMLSIQAAGGRSKRRREILCTSRAARCIRSGTTGRRMRRCSSRFHRRVRWACSSSLKNRSIQRRIASQPRRCLAKS